MKSFLSDLTAALGLAVLFCGGAAAHIPLAAAGCVMTLGGAYMGGWRWRRR